MKKEIIRLILTGLIFLSIPIVGLGQSKLGAEFYSNLFDGNSLSDGGTQSIVGSSTSMVSIENNALKFTFNRMLQYEMLGTIEFTNSIDLTKNGNITIKSKWDGLITDPVPTTGQADFSPSICFYLYDDLGLKTGGDNSYWQIQINPPKDVWSSSTINLKQFPNTVDFTKIKKIEIRYYSSNKIVSGNLFFDFIHLGNVPSVLPIQTKTTFINTYESLFASDIVQSTSTEKGGHSQQDGKLTVPVPASYSAWNTYYTVKLNKPIDLTHDKSMKLSMEVINGAVGSGERPLNKEFSPRLIDVDGRRCVLNGSVLNGATKGEYNLDFASGYLEDGVFDFKKVKEFRLMSGATNRHYPKFCVNGNSGSGFSRELNPDSVFKDS